MYDNGTSIEYVRVALALGVMLSVIISDRRRIPGGGVAAAGYLGLFANRPLYAIATVSLSLVTYFLVTHVLAKVIVLHGRRRLVVLTLVGVILNFLAGLVATEAADSATWLGALDGVGLLVPGLLAQDIQRHGFRLKILSVLGSPLLTVSITAEPDSQGLESTRPNSMGPIRKKARGGLPWSPATKLRLGPRRQRQLDGLRPRRRSPLRKLDRAARHSVGVESGLPVNLVLRYAKDLLKAWGV